MQLFYNNIVVGEITDAFEHQGTWFGTFECLLKADGEPTSEQLGEFIEFCRDWFARAGADGSEFDRFGDIVFSSKWSVEKAGVKVKIVDAPMFLDGLRGEISWIC